MHGASTHRHPPAFVRCKCWSARQMSRAPAVAAGHSWVGLPVHIKAGQGALLANTGTSIAADVLLDSSPLVGDIADCVYNRRHQAQAGGVGGVGFLLLSSPKLQIRDAKTGLPESYASARACASSG